MKPLSRRALLRGFSAAGLVTVGLPLLECMSDRRAYACGGIIPRRFGLFFWGNGNIPSRWTPTGEGPNWQVSEQLSPLTGLESRVTVVTGMSVKVPNAVPHMSGAAGILSGAKLSVTDAGETFLAPSIDQVIAAEIGGDTAYRSLQTAATNNEGLSYNGPNSKNPPDTDPYALYERLFGPSFRAPGEGGVVDPTLALRRSVLDAVSGDLVALQSRVGAADKARLDQHATGLRELELRLARLQADPPNLEACSRPPSPTLDFSDVEGRPQISARSRAMVDLLAMAFACDQTRVFGHYISQPVNNYLFPGASQGHHELTHNEADPQPEVNAITTMCVDEYAYLVRALDAIPEEDGTLLDNCAVLGCTEVSLGRTHSLDEMPLLIAGNACGFLKQGIHYRSPSLENASMVLLSLIRSMGVVRADFGQDEAHVTSSLIGIEA